MNGKCALYRHFDKAGKLLYVGVAIQPISRTRDHSHTAEWFHRVVRIEIEWCASREAALWAEGTAIKNEKPEFNIIRPGKYGIAARSPEHQAKCQALIDEAAAMGIRLERNACLSRLEGTLKRAKAAANLPS